MGPRLFSLLAIAMAGCAPGNPGLYIGNVLAPNDQCEYSTSNIAITQGVLDVSVPGNSYVAVLALNNQLMTLAQTGNSGYPVMSEPNVILVDSVEVELRDIGGAPLGLSGPNPVTVPAGAVAIPVGDGTSPGLAIGTVTVVPAAYVGDIAGIAGANGTIVASMRAIGHTLGGAEVASPEFNFPIQVCSGCLLSCAVDGEGAPICQPSCTPGQDFPHVECVSATDLTPTISSGCRAGGA